MKTRAEIDDLILAWRDDPSWEIEETEGFEDHKDELRAFRLKCEAEWKERAQKEHAEAIASLVKPGMDLLLGMAKQREAADSDPAYFWRGLGDHRSMLAAVAEMLLPIKKQLDRVNAEHERVVADLRDELHELRRQIGAAR